MTLLAWRLQGEALAYHAMGRADAADAALARMTERFGGDSAFQIAEVHAFRGDNDAAMAWLERAYDQRDGGFVHNVAAHGGRRFYLFRTHGADGRPRGALTLDRLSELLR